MSGWHQSTQWKRTRQAALWAWMMSGRPPCPLCERPIEPEAGDKIHVDHVRPASDGGPKWDPRNCRVTHATCNLSRTKGGTSISAQRRRKQKERSGWKEAPEDAALRAGAVAAVHSREW